MIHEFRNPIPVVFMDDDGKPHDSYAIYVRDGNTFENDCWGIALCESGRVIHVLSDRIRIYKNATYGINVGESGSYTKQWFDNFYKGVSVGTPKINSGTTAEKRWSDEDMVRFSAFCKFAPGKEISEQLESFKEKQNIK